MENRVVSAKELKASKQQDKDVVLAMRGIDKRFPGTKALNKVDFTLRKGEIHALMGENGAGKSTLIKVLTGVHEKDGGSIWVEGVDGEAHIHSPQEAQDIGIATVYQEITLCPNLTVAENMFIGRNKGQMVHWKDYENRANEILKSLGVPARAKQELGNCSLAVQQMVAIARAVDMNCKVLILDEPTSSLDDKEVQMLFGLMRDLKSRVVGIIFVTHFLEQVYEVSDRITVLRNGELVGEYPISDLPHVELVARMMGKNLDDLADLEEIGQKKTAGEKVVYQAKDLSSSESKPFDFVIHEGEVNGFTVLDDYAHHPQEIEATLAAAKLCPHNRIHVIFQPHTYTRTKALLSEFAKALAGADEVILADIYAAREKNTIGISSADIGDLINTSGGRAVYIPTFEKIKQYVLETVQEGDLLITMGAGNVVDIADQLIS